ncbi:MAG: alpha/beta fold hydrolase [Gemmatimonadetes bacterium]|nr:alpha/beta fold hydrolase [Gemmatimonadota bacterium]
MGQLNNLQSLWLANNQLTGEIPQALGQLNNLKYLVLTGNQLTGCIPLAFLDPANDLNDPRPAFCLPGRANPISIFTVSFPSNDGIEVSAIFGTAQDGESLPVVILLHDLGGSKADWLNNTGTYVALLERGYAVLAIDMRGHGDTPIPDDRQFLELIDIELSYRDVEAALIWLSSQPEIDISRIAVVGSGLGGNVAYVSSGFFPAQIKTSVSLSPGLWGGDSLEPLVIEAGLEPFAPRSILFMVGDQEQIDTGDVILSYAEFARNLEAQTVEPKELRIFPGSADHGFELLDNIAEAQDLFFLWLEEHL